MVSNYRKIGLTGGIGCGKSTVLDIFKSLGCPAIDTDAICHGIYDSNNEFKEKLSLRWGKQILDSNDNIERKRIGKIVFADKEELKWLNDTIHPLIFAEVEKKALISKSSCKAVMYDVPLLFEVGWDKMFDEIISVWTPEDIQIERLKQRNWDDSEIRNRLKSQLSNELKLSKAHYGIITSGSLRLLNMQCKIILKK